MMRRTQGSALVIVLAIACLLAVQIYIINAFSTSNFRHVNRVNAHVRAIAMCETVYSRVLARLKGAAWADRWFREKAWVEKDVALANGTYSAYVATVPDPDRHLADVWVESRYDGSVVGMFWRVRYVEGTLDLYAQVQPDFFTFVPGTTPPPISTAGPGPLNTVVQGMIDVQRRNRARIHDTLVAIDNQPNLNDILKKLGLKPRAPTRDDSFPPGGAAPQPQGPYVGSVRSGLPPGGPLNGLPGVPPGPALPGTDLLAKWPTPSNMPGVMTDIFAGQGLPPASAPTTADFNDPNAALRHWTDASDAMNRQQLQQMMDAMGRYLDEMAARYGATGCAPCFDALSTTMDYLRAATAAEAARTGKRPPVAAQVDARPFNGSAYRRALSAYGNWWF